MSSISIGLSALRVNQRVLDVIGQNITNANTPGYHRQIPNLVSRTAGQQVGTGVEINQIRQFRSSLLETAVLQNTQDTQSVSAQLDVVRQAQAVLAPGDGSIHDLLEQVFNQFEQLAASPGDLQPAPGRAQRRERSRQQVQLHD